MMFKVLAGIFGSGGIAGASFERLKDIFNIN